MNIIKTNVKGPAWAALVFGSTKVLSQGKSHEVDRVIEEANESGEEYIMIFIPDSTANNVYTPLSGNIRAQDCLIKIEDHENNNRGY